MSVETTVTGDGRAPWTRPGEYWPALSRALREAPEPPPQPLVVVDLAAFDHNLRDLMSRASGMPVRVATKSVRCRALVDRAAAEAGGGLLAYSLAEAVWLSSVGSHADILVGYPTADRAAIAALLDAEQACRRVTLMVDDPAQLDLVDAVRPPGRRPEVRVAIDLDLSYLPPRAARLTGRVGVYRSPVATPEQARTLAREIVARPGFRLVGAMGYEAQIAGVGDIGNGPTTRVLRRLQAASWVDVLERRSAMVAAITGVAGPLEIVNGGGTGSVHLTSQDPCVTDVAAGSGLLGPTLFDTYRAFTPAPAASFGLPVVRRPAEDVATVGGGGWIASGPPGPDRLPRLVWPEGAKLLPREMAGEVQTPLRGRAARELAVGDLTWWRHAKAGELMEHASQVLLVRSARDEVGEVVVELVGRTPTYRGEGRSFG